MKVPTTETNIARLISSADLARDSRRWSEAEVLYRTALDVNDSLAPIWVQYGHALKEQKKLQQAEGAYSRAIEIDSANADTHLQMGHLRKVQGNLTDAAA